MNAVDKKYHRLSELYKKHEDFKENPTIWDIALWFNKMTYDEKKLIVIQDSRIARQNARCLHAYIVGRIGMDQFFTAAELEMQNLLLGGLK